MSPTTEKFYRAHAYIESLWKDKNLRSLVDRQRDKAPPERAAKALSEFRKLFQELKVIAPVRDVEHDEPELVFVFTRGCPEDQRTPCGEDEAEWTKEIDQAAA